MPRDYEDLGDLEEEFAEEDDDSDTDFDDTDDAEPEDFKEDSITEDTGYLGGSLSDGADDEEEF